MHLKGDWHFGCFCLVAIINNAAMNTHIWFLCGHVFSLLLGFYLGLESLGHLAVEELPGWFPRPLGHFHSHDQTTNEHEVKRPQGARHQSSQFLPSSRCFGFPVRPSDALYLRGTLTAGLLSSCLHAVSKVWVFNWGKSCELWAMRGSVWTGWGHVYKWNRISGALRDQSETGRGKRAEANG